MSIKIAFLRCGMGAVETLERHFSRVRQIVPLECEVVEVLLAANVADHFATGKVSTILSLQGGEEKREPKVNELILYFSWEDVYFSIPSGQSILLLSCLLIISQY